MSGQSREGGARHPTCNASFVTVTFQPVTMTVTLYRTKRTPPFYLPADDQEHRGC
jgi:hypothetical protein